MRDKQNKNEKNIIQNPDLSKSEKELTKRKGFFKDVIDSIQDGISILDKDLNILFINSAMKKWYFHKLPLIGMKCYDAYHGRKLPCEICPSMRTLKTGKQDFDIVPLTGSEGIKGWLELFTFPLEDSKTGQLLGVIEYVRDISDLKPALTLVDELTGLYNRRGFFTLAQQQLKIADRLQRSLFLIFADLDGLKNINDNFGHQEGTLALIDTANILKETFRESDIIARIGSNEFVIMAMETADTDPDVFDMRLKEYVRSYNATGNRRYKLSISIGIASYDPYFPCSLEELIEKADTSMYEQKRKKKRD